MSAPQPRLFESDLTPKASVVTFQDKEYTVHHQITALGGFAIQATDWVGILIGKNTHVPAIAHYRKIVDRCPALNHNNMQIRDHIQV